jgi:hypothetical protein
MGSRYKHKYRGATNEGISVETNYHAAGAETGISVETNYLAAGAETMAFR